MNLDRKSEIAKDIKGILKIAAMLFLGIFGLGVFIFILNFSFILGAILSVFIISALIYYYNKY